MLSVSRHSTDRNQAYALDSGTHRISDAFPLLNFPDDVIREILVACIEESSVPSMNMWEAPMLLTRICARVRQIALRTPVLWAAIHIPIVNDVLQENLDLAQGILANRTCLIKEWLLVRSGCLPLRITIQEANQYGGDSSNLCDDILDIVFSCCRRWKEVHFEASPQQIKGRLEKLTASDVPFLDTVYLKFLGTQAGMNSSSTRMDDVLHFTSNSIFKRLAIYSPRISSSTWGVTAWTTLTDLALPQMLWDDSSMVILAGTLRQCASLTSLHIAVRMNIGTALEEIHLDHLRYLNVEEGADECVGFPGILSVMHAPKLQALVYRNALPLMSTPNSLRTLLQRAAYLTYFSIWGFQTLSALCDCLGNCPELVTLRVENTKMKDRAPASDDQFISAFYSHTGDSHLCPKLETIICNTALDISVDGLRNFIMGKAEVTPGMVRWKQIQLAVYYDLWDKSCMKEIEEQGISAGIKLMLVLHRRLRIPVELYLPKREETLYINSIFSLC